MSANRWKKLHSRKTYRERGQSEDRAHLGLLEKKKDYQQRARDFHRKQDAIHALEVKAAFRNPDEFFHKMIKTKKKDGKHVSLDADMEPTLAEKLNLQTSDIAYLSMKKQMEDRKIARMQGTLQMSRDKSPEELKSTHTVFVDTPEEAAEFEEAEHFDTAPEYMGRAFNRPTKKQLEEGDVLVTRGLSKHDIKRAERMRSLAYGELSARMKRSQQMQDTLERLELRRNLQVRPH
jgi:U3 small nucleolar RNA-associated protein 11